MFVYIIIGLATVSVAFELFLFSKFPALLKFCKQFPLVGIGLSMFLSVFLAGLFHAGGMAVAAAAIISTLATAIYYSVANGCRAIMDRFFSWREC